MVMDDYEIDDLPCPACGHPETRSRHCAELDCDDGFYHDCGEDCCCCADPVPNVECDECSGNGIVRWCAACGADYWRAKERADTPAGPPLRGG
jgi:hypothetical protein